MFGLTRLSPFDDVFNVQREFDRLFNQFWHELPAQTAAAAPGFQVKATDGEWRLEIPMAGIDPQHVTIEAAGNTLSVRAEDPGDSNGGTATRYQQTLTLPPFLDLEKINASHRHGMLQLTLPLKESVKPRRIQIDTTADSKQLTSSAA